MRPFFPPQDLVNGAFVDGILHGKGFWSSAAIRVALSDQTNICLGQSGGVMGFAARQGRPWATSCLPALADFVSGIVGVCSKEKMIRTNTRTIVAPMADKQSTGNGAEVQFPRKAMRGNRITIDLKSFVSTTACGRPVNPTTLGLGHIPTKPLFRQPVASGVRAGTTTEVRSAGLVMARIGAVFSAAMQAIQCRSHAGYITQIDHASQGWVAL